MKRVLLLGSLMLGLSACGGGGGGGPTPDTSYPYNPNASATASSDARIPYRGDWVFAALLADDTERSGVVAITDKYSNAKLGVVNAGGGLAAWCVKSPCAQDDEQGVGLIGSISTKTGAELVAGMVPKNSPSPRFFMADNDGKVETRDGRATMIGEGVWTSAAGTDQAATFVFIQVNSKSALSTQQARQQALLAAQELSRAPHLTAPKAAPLGEVRAALEQALAR